MIATRPAWRRGCLVALGVIAALMAWLGLGFGAIDLSLGDIVLGAVKRAVSWGEVAQSTSPREMIFFSLRLPRVLAGLLVGATLAVAGASLQGIFRNPLADPGLIGVSSGAALAVVVSIVLGARIATWLGAAPETWSGSSHAMAFVAFLGALVATWLVLKLGLGRGGRIDVTLLILAGVAINALAGAVIGMMTYLADDAELRSLTMWTLGSLTGVGWTELGVIALGSSPGLAWLLLRWQRFDLLILGEREAAHLGLDVHRFQRLVVMACAMVVGVGVAFTGMIGFVGLIVPHIMRLLGGASHRFVLPGSALLGGALLVGADTLARTLAAPAELPIGVLTSLIGAPFFIYMLLSARGGLS